MCRWGWWTIGCGRARLRRSNQRKQRPTAEKESQRWLASLERAQQRVPETAAVVTIADSEADIFDLLVLPRREGSHILIRATHNRRVETASHLYSTKAGGWSIHVGIAAEGRCASTTSAHERAVCELNA